MRNITPTSSLSRQIPIEVWKGKAVKFDRCHNFGCLVQYLRVGSDRARKGEKFAPRTCFGVFLRHVAGGAGYLVFDPNRAGVVTRSDVRFFDDVPGYPRIMGGRAPQIEEKAENHFFSLFPDTGDEEEEAEAVPPAQLPAAAPVPAAAANNPPANQHHVQFQLPAAAAPIDVIALSDSQSGVNNAGGAAGEEPEVQGGGVSPEVKGRSKAERVMMRRRANFAQYGDVL